MTCTEHLGLGVSGEFPGTVSPGIHSAPQPQVARALATRPSCVLLLFLWLRRMVGGLLSSSTTRNNSAILAIRKFQGGESSEDEGRACQNIQRRGALTTRWL